MAYLNWGAEIKLALLHLSGWDFVSYVDEGGWKYKVEGMLYSGSVVLTFCHKFLNIKLCIK